MSTNKQEPPFCLQIELTEGCNLRCSFCGLNGIRGKANDLKCMTLAQAEALAHAIKATGWNSRLEFAMHGEPTANREYVAILGMFRTVLGPKRSIMLTSNGMDIARGDPVAKLHALFDAGVNTVALDQYQGITLVPKIRAAVHQFIHSHGAELNPGPALGVTKLQDGRLGCINVYEYPACGPVGSPHARSERQQRLVFIAPIDASTTGNHSMLNNHAGAAAPPLATPLRARCAKPFREMAIRWNGDVALCCNDWRGEYKVGNAYHEGLASLWMHPRMVAARKKLLASERDFGPCAKCDATSYRPGLLPDKLGKGSMTPFTPDDAEALRAATQGPSYTLPVLRPWEQA